MDNPCGHLFRSHAYDSRVSAGIALRPFKAHRFSKFQPIPLFVTRLLIYLLLPFTRRMLEAWRTSG